jgi:uncharacterized protein
MPAGSFYVYALFDPRDVPPIPFYVGKGSGSRAYAHLTEEGEGRKNRRIRDIHDAGFEVTVRQLVTGLSEIEALTIEAQLIAAHGTVDTGGILLNKVLPSGDLKRPGPTVTVPPGAPEKAQLGLNLLKESILELAAANPKGIRNSDAVGHLGLQSDHAGQNKNYLSWSILGILMREGRVKKVAATGGRQAYYEYVKIGDTGAA